LDQTQICKSKLCFVLDHSRFLTNNFDGSYVRAVDSANYKLKFLHWLDVRSIASYYPFAWNQTIYPPIFV